MPPDRWRVFLDTNVLIAGMASHTGASAAILDLGESEEILVVLSRQVLIEADRTFSEKFPHLTGRFRIWIENLSPLLADDPTPSSVHEAARVIHLNDAPILAAAKQEQVEYLVTLNTRHFLTSKARSYFIRPIVTPAEFLLAFRHFWEQSA